MIDYDVSDGICVLRLNGPPVNTITFALLEALADAVGRANSDPEVRGILLTGDARHFSAGADVGIFEQITRPADAMRTSRIFQEAFQHVEDSAKPIVAAVGGKVMGSALELATACHYRICTAATRFSLPEVNLGINPGAGGTQRLPRLIGPGEALKMLLTGRAISAARALELGLVDAVCAADELKAKARAMLQPPPPLRRTGELTEKVADAEAVQAAFDGAERILAAVRPEIVAPRKIVEAVRTGLAESFGAGLAAEQTAFAECMETLATRNKIYLFFATRKTGKVLVPSEAKPARIAKAAVIGMGSMGAGIAHAILIGGLPVVVLDEDAAALERGEKQIARSLDKRVEGGKMSAERAQAMMSLLTTTTEWADVADADLVIEAVYEDAAVKRSVLAAVEDVSGDETILATNTSTISLDVLAEGLRRPERLVGLHFFNPAHRMPLLEVIRPDGASGRAVATALAFAKAIRKTPVVVRNREGFLVNRIFVPYFKEAFWLLEDGADPAAIDEAMAAFGFPMGPLTLIDMAGLDILAHVDEVMEAAFPRHGRLSAVARELVARGRAGQKAGGGVYDYDKGDRTPRASEATAEIVAEVRRERGVSPRRFDRDEITRRLVLRMVNEAFYVLAEGIAQRESDIDAAMVLGTGFPDFRGGVVKYARDTGLANVLAELDALAGRVGGRFAPCPLLREMAAAANA